MDNYVFLSVTIFVAIVFILMTFALFVIGFLIGYKREDKKMLLNKRQNEIQETEESDKEKRAKQEWKNFLNYDGSSPIDY